MTHRSVRIALTAVVSAALIATTAACGSQAEGEEGGKVKLSFVYMGTPEQQQQWNKLFAEFEKKNPDIDLEAQPSGVDNWAAFFNKISTQMAGGQMPDLIQVATEGQRMFASKGLLEPLDEYIAKDQAYIDEYYADMDPNLIEWNKKYASPDGKTYYLPGEFNTMGLWCNKDLFAKAGATLPEPGGDWTWEEFEAAAPLIKEKTGAYLYDAPAAYFAGVMPWVTTAGGSTLSDDWKSATFDSPPVVESATFLRGLVDQGYSPKPGGNFDAFTAFAQDKLACFGSGRWPIINMRNLGAVEKARIVKFPTKVGDGSPVGWNAYPILKSSKHKEEAWRFIKYLISEEGSSYFAQVGGTIVPARRSIATSDEYLANSPEGTELFYDALSYSIPIPSPDRGAEVMLAIEDVWKQIMAGNLSPEEGTAKAQSQIQGYLEP